MVSEHLNPSKSKSNKLPSVFVLLPPLGMTLIEILLAKFKYVLTCILIVKSATKTNYLVSQTYSIWCFIVAKDLQEAKHSYRHLVFGAEWMQWIFSNWKPINHSSILQIYWYYTSMKKTMNKSAIATAVAHRMSIWLIVPNL